MKNANRPASPVENCITDDSGSYLGLTKREHFAGLAMQGMITSKYFGEFKADELSKMAIDFSDELLKELDK